MNQIQLHNYTSTSTSRYPSGPQLSAAERKKWYRVTHYTWLVASWIWTIIVTCLVGFAINSLTTPPEANPLARTIIGALQATAIGHMQWSAIILIIMLLALIVTMLAFLVQLQLKPAHSNEFQGVIDMAGQDNILTELQNIRRLLEQTINATQIQHREQVVVQRTTTQALNTIHQILQRLYQKSLEPVRIQTDQFTTITNQARIFEALQHLEQLIEHTQEPDIQEPASLREVEQEPIVAAPSDQDVPGEAQEDNLEDQGRQPTQPMTPLSEKDTDQPREAPEDTQEEQDVEPTQPMAKLIGEAVEEQQ